MAFFSNYIQYLLLDDITEKDIEKGLRESTWDDIVQEFSVHERRNKKVGRYFVPAAFKPREEWVYTEHTLDANKSTYRNESNVEAITMAVLDLDEEGAIEEAKRIFRDYNYFVYSTHSYSQKTPYKFRMVLKLNEPIKITSWPVCFASMMAGINGDTSCGNISRLYYTPSCPDNSNVKPVFFQNKGKDLSMKDILAIGRQHGFNGLESKRSVDYKPKEVMHFSGKKVVVNRAGIKKNTFSYSEMEKRQQSLLNTVLAEDRRHDFALRVISSEVARYKDQVDLYRLTQFLILSAREYSSKCLLKGDTLSEMPEMVASAFGSFARDQIASMQEAYGMPLMEIIKNEIEAAKASVVTNRIEAESPFRRSHSGTTQTKNGYSQFRAENKGAILAFAKDGDVPALFKNTVYENAVARGVSLDTMKEMEYLMFLVVQKERHQGFSDSQILDSVQAASADIKGFIDQVSRSTDGIDCQKLVAATDMCALIAKKALLNEGEWSFPVPPQYLKQPTCESAGLEM